MSGLMLANALRVKKAGGYFSLYDIIVTKI
jgi:hypothetical protein